MDFGGMYGVSMLRLAKSMQDLVEKGEVAFVITNLAFTPKAGLEMFNDINNDMNAQERELFRQNVHLVHYIQSDAGELREQKIAIPGRGEVNLFGKVDLIHEDYALQHSFIQDTDLPNLSDAMSRYGMLFSGSRGIDAIRSIHPLGDSIKAAYVVGKRNMLRKGIQRVQLNIRFPHYEVYVNASSPTASLKEFI